MPAEFEWRASHTASGMNTQERLAEKTEGGRSAGAAAAGSGRGRGRGATRAVHSSPAGGLQAQAWGHSLRHVYHDASCTLAQPIRSRKAAGRHLNHPN